MTQQEDKYPKILKELYSKARSEICGSEKTPDILYQYTSMEAAQIILESNQIRYSHTYFMNDSLEIRKGLEIIFHSLHDKAEEQKDHKDIGTLLVRFAYILVIILEDEKTRLETLADLEKQGFKDFDPAQFEEFEKLNQHDYFISCFSEEKDSLPMWYMYADNAKGVALGFDCGKLLTEHNNLLEGKGDYLLATKIIYEEKKFKALVLKFIESLIQIAFESKKNGGGLTKLLQEEKGNSFFFSAIYYLSILAVSFKDSSFAHEKEWRLFTTIGKKTNVPNKNFAVHNGILKPYHFISYPTANAQKLTKLIVAPGNPNSTEWLKIYLANIGSTCREIMTSEIPFRNV